uniref:Uncharacterized protein n=1 Tax=Arion vulgaris TaxID=1028688 RepID=A0A0B7BES9_9EUPU
MIVEMPDNTKPMQMHIFLDLLVSKTDINLLPMAAQIKDPIIRNKFVREASKPVSCTENFKRLLKKEGRYIIRT